MSEKYNVPPLYALSVGIVESQLTHRTPAGKLRVSRVGALGIFQVRPFVAPDYNLTNRRENIEAGIKILSGLITHFKGDKWKAAEAYNCGLSGRRGKWKKAAKRYRLKVSLTYVRSRKLGYLWNIYTKKAL